MLRDALAHAGSTGRALVGFDFPIGVPSEYARVAGVDCFRTLLAGVGVRAPWERFWEAAAPEEQPTVHRPLYPARNGPKGTVKKSALATGIGVKSFDSLKRAIDREQNAECMFWALGAKQVAKACFVGWREELQPSLGAVRLWPFDGPLPELMSDPGVVVAEIYPAASMRRIDVTLHGSKADQDARRRATNSIMRALDRIGCAADADARSQIESGFATGGDDAFDATMAAISMLDVVTRHSPQDEPPGETERRTEGWILGVR